MAKRFGLTERFVRSRLRLADLADPIFEALRNGEITLNVAVAYASNSDRARQAEVFELLKDGYYRTNVNEIKRQLAEDTYVGSDPKALLVGRDAYIEAGGRVDLDLFSDSATERWIDGHLLNRLVADKLAVAAEQLREREGLAEVRIIPATHVTYNDTWDLRPLKGETPELTAEQQTRLEQLEVEIEAANEAWDEADEEGQADLANRVELLEAEYRSIENQTPILTEEQKAGALAYVVIGHDGEPRLHEQLYIAPVDADADEESVEEGGDEDAVEAEVVTAPGKPVYSQRLSQELAEMKSELLRVHIASDPRFALDLGTFWMVDKATRRSGAYDLATELKADKPWSSLTGFQSGTLAAEEWGKIDEALDRSWTEAGDTCQRYDAFCDLPDEARAAWLAWAVARTLHAVTADSKAVTFINHLGTKLDIDVAAWWRPTANNYFDRVSSKAAILAHLDEIGGKELSSRYGASKKHDLATSAEKIFAGTVPIEAEIRDAALAWVPDVMRYAEAPIETDDVEPVPVNDEHGDATDDELPHAA